MSHRDPAQRRAYHREYVRRQRREALARGRCLQCYRRKAVGCRLCAVCLPGHLRRARESMRLHRRARGVRPTILKYLTFRQAADLRRELRQIVLARNTLSREAQAIRRDLRLYALRRPLARSA